MEFGEGCILQSVCVCVCVCVCVGANYFGLLSCMNVYYEVEAQGCNTLSVSQLFYVAVQNG